MILVAGLTPAWQQIVVLNQLRIGDVNRASETHWCASGKVLNVGLALTRLGSCVRTLSMIGSDAAGDAMRHDMLRHQVDVRWVQSAARQRVCTTLLDQATERTTEIVENFPPCSPSELKVFERAFVEEASASAIEFVVLTGSLPTRTPPNDFARLLSYVRVPAILDIRGTELLAALPYRPLVVKPNREELAHSVGRELTGDDDVWQAMSEINALGAEWVIVTNGSREVFASRNAERLRFTPPAIEVVNPIGSGDCFTAGLVWALQQGKSMPDSISCGIAIAAQNAQQLLPAVVDTGRSHPSQVRSPPC